MTKTDFEIITDARLSVDYDTYTMSVADIIRRVGEGRIDLNPDYQRYFVWDEKRQSRLIESLILGIPIPDIFMSYNADGDSDTWEVVDGLQRITTIIGFVDPNNEALSVDTREKLMEKLGGLRELAQLNGKSFQDFAPKVQNFIRDRYVKMVVLNDKSSQTVKYELFERLNTGGIRLKPQEIRNVMFRGRFMELLHELAKSQLFEAVVWSNSMDASDKEEMILKFFAYRDYHLHFTHSVEDFLLEYSKYIAGEFEKDATLKAKYKKTFDQTFSALAQKFPNKIRRKQNSTPKVLFEAISVAASNVIDQGRKLNNGGDEVLLDKELAEVTTGYTNSPKSLKSRLERAEYLLTR